MKNLKTLIFTATYNEAKNILKFINKVEKLNLNVDLLIIDDNSPDQTSKVITNYSKNKNYIKLIVRKNKQGLDTAHKLAYKFALKNNYQNLITMDADLSHNPKEIPKILEQLKNYKFVIGSRYIKGGRCQMSGYRLWLSFYGNKLIKNLLNINCNEFTTSYRGFNLKKLKNFNLNIVSSKGYSFFMETIYQIHKKKNLIKEIPITFIDRKKGKSKIPKIEIFRTFVNLFKIKFFK